MAYKNSDEDILYSTSLFILGLSSSMLNLVVLITFLRFRVRIFGRKNNRILFSMALADSLVGLFIMSLGLCILTRQDIMVYRITANIPLFGSMFVSIFSMALFTGDRLVAVKFPLRYSLVVTSKRLRCLIVASWILSVIFTVQQYILLHVTSSMELRVRGAVLVIFTVVGSIFLALSNSYLYATVKEQSKKIVMFKASEKSEIITESESFVSRSEETAENNTRGSWRISMKTAKAKKNELKVSKECVVIIFVFICCWLPLTGYRLYHSFVKPPNIRVLRRLFLLIASLSSIINPYVYFFRKKQFRKYLTLNSRPSIKSNSSGN